MTTTPLSFTPPRPHHSFLPPPPRPEAQSSLYEEAPGPESENSGDEDFSILHSTSPFSQSNPSVLPKQSLAQSSQTVNNFIARVQPLISPAYHNPTLPQPAAPTPFSSNFSPAPPLKWNKFTVSPTTRGVPTAPVAPTAPTAPVAPTTPTSNAVEGVDSDKGFADMPIPSPNDSTPSGRNTQGALHRFDVPALLKKYPELVGKPVIELTRRIVYGPSSTSPKSKSSGLHPALPSLPPPPTAANAPLPTSSMPPPPGKSGPKTLTQGKHIYTSPASLSTSPPRPPNPRMHTAPSLEDAETMPTPPTTPTGHPDNASRTSLAFSNATLQTPPQNTKARTNSSRGAPAPYTEAPPTDKKLNGFSVIIYYTQTTSQSPLVAQIQAIANVMIPPSTETRFIVFFYKKATAEKVTQLFALTTGRGWQRIQTYTDHKFPFEMMTRFCDPQCVKSMSQRPSDTRIALAMHVLRREAPMNTLDCPDSKLLTISCGLSQDNNPLYTLRCFPPPSNQKRTPVRLEAHTNSLGFSSETLKIQDYAAILEIFSSVDPNSPAPAKWDFLNHVIVSDPSCLEILEHAIENISLNDHPNLHLHFPDTNVADRQLMIGESTSHFAASPYAILLDEIAIEPDTQSPITVRGLRNVFLATDREDQPWEPLASYVEGDLYLDAGPFKGRYHRLHHEGKAIWYKMHASRLKIFQEACAVILKPVADKGCLAPPGNPAYLPYAWPQESVTDKSGKTIMRPVSEGAYNRWYLGRKNYLFGDKIYYQEGKSSVELFDLLYYDPEANKIFIYQIKGGLINRDIRAAASQITLAASIIADCCANPEKNNELKRWYQAMCAFTDKNIQHRDAVHAQANQWTAERFLSLFRNKKNIVFVLATTDSAFEGLKSDGEYTIAKKELPALYTHVTQLGFELRIVSIPPANPGQQNHLPQAPTAPTAPAGRVIVDLTNDEDLRPKKADKKPKRAGETKESPTAKKSKASSPATLPRPQQPSPLSAWLRPKKD